MLKEIFLDINLSTYSSTRYIRGSRCSNTAESKKIIFNQPESFFHNLFELDAISRNILG